MKIRYTGRASERSISRKDFSDNSFNHEAVTLNAENEFTADVDKEVGKWLTETNSDIVEVKGDEATASGSGKTSASSKSS